jgi:hypothetical protein
LADQSAPTVLALNTITNLAAGAAIVRTLDLDVEATGNATVKLFVGRRAAGATVPPAAFRLEASPKGSGGGQWFTVTGWTLPEPPGGSGTYTPETCEAEAVTGTNSAGQKVVTVASTTGITAGTYLFFDNTTVANSEFGVVALIVPNTSITLVENLAHAQNSGASTIYTSTNYNHGHQRVMHVDNSQIGRLRLVVDCTATAAPLAVLASAVVV